MDALGTGNASTSELIEVLLKRLRRLGRLSL